MACITVFSFTYFNVSTYIGIHPVFIEEGEKGLRRGTSTCAIRRQQQTASEKLLSTCLHMRPDCSTLNQVAAVLAGRGLWESLTGGQ